MKNFQDFLALNLLAGAVVLWQRVGRPPDKSANGA